MNTFMEILLCVIGGIVLFISAMAEPSLEWLVVISVLGVLWVAIAMRCFDEQDRKEGR